MYVRVYSTAYTTVSTAFSKSNSKQQQHGADGKAGGPGEGRHSPQIETS